MKLRLKNKTIAIMLAMMLVSVFFVSCTQKNIGDKVSSENQNLENEKEEVINEVMNELNQITIDIDYENSTDEETNELLNVLTE